MEVIAHPSCFDEKVFGEESISAPYSAADMAGICRYRPCDGPCNISGQLGISGRDTGCSGLWSEKSHWQDKDKRKWQDDYVRDDSALVLPPGGRKAFYYNRVFPQRYMQYKCNTPNRYADSSGFSAS